MNLTFHFNLEGREAAKSPAQLDIVYGSCDMKNKNENITLFSNLNASVNGIGEEK